MPYNKQTPETLLDNEWYWVRYKYDYMEMLGCWILSQGATIKMYSKNLECEIKGPIERPE